MKTLFHRLHVRNHDRGFSLFELIAILMLISILTLILVSKNGIDNKDLVFEADVLKSNIRYVQQLALLNDQVSLRIKFTPDEYTLIKNDSDTSISFPSDDSATHTIHPEIEMTANPGGEIGVFDLTFDKWGGISKIDDFTIRLTDTRIGLTESFRILKNTGYIP